ncbi:YrhK family protein [Amorphus orientalis]|uniref:Membrane channel-forming protein YqfA (Hemolysin III family) n=1 Tax=Amorphus orientalis TaxID=649198 RepID=A0AAE3VR96_9HYPH|nr:YrhK family protein [Amorphus orientalis]MDQ0317289.1 putative membrane channel-forming protein YqfA (hemolysin III family) [Amorphus orientalis]
MPHMFVNRSRLHDLIGDDPDRKSNFRWETINAVTYELGGLVFIAGSICFFPALSAYADLGAWIFFAGSLLYLLVTGHDLVEVVTHARRRSGPPDIWDRLELVAALTYVTGTLLFVVGSIFFLSQVDLPIAGAWCFVIGSILFVAGAVINVLQIVQADDLLTLQLMNLTALTFVIGSVLFAVASIPYLWAFASDTDERMVDAFLAWQYLVGSVLFFAGGLFNYRRAYRVVAHKLGVSTAIEPRPIVPLPRRNKRRSS